MLARYAIAFAAIAALMLGWVVVQRVARGFAERHPETGPYREVGCAGGCGHCGQPCATPADAPGAVSTEALVAAPMPRRQTRIPAEASPR